ncbi:hypothetical protein Krac_6424 [Ktedonobacter racemifer DSM 44963]|uniref:Uncharacterized protein n=1 Tax=Ktedonobacter racemifer DSM 44963 TaxID=485913 RepID=D6TUR6_KTERA|nr:hypothetical protein Krac_6424 [Ktedonobacter racemifer DSM 44963]
MVQLFGSIVLHSAVAQFLLAYISFAQVPIALKTYLRILCRIHPLFLLLL